MSVIAIPRYVRPASTGFEPLAKHAAPRWGTPIWNADPASARQPDPPDSAEIEVRMLALLYAERYA